MGRGWITLDGREVVNMCSFVAQGAIYDEALRLRRASGCTDYRKPAQRAGYYRACEEAQATVRARGIFARHEFTGALFNYLNLDIESILSSPDPITRAIGMLDRRVGRRRLAKIDVTGENELVRTLHRFRCDAEGSR